MAETTTARFPRIRNLGLRDPLRNPEVPLVQRPRPSGFEAGVSQLRKNFPTATGRAQEVVTSTQTGGQGLVEKGLRGAGRGVEQIVGGVANLPSTLLDVAQSGALQQPLFSTPGIEAARVESGRVAEAVGAPRLFNELPEGVEPLTSFDPATVAQAGGDIAEQIAGTTSLAPAAPIGPVTSAPVNTGFEQFAQANQGIRPGGQGAPVLEGSRIIRRPGETPILTNLTGSALESGLADNRQFVTNETTGQSRTLDPDTLALEGISPVGEAGPVAGGGLRTRARTQEEEILKGIEGKDFSFGRRPTTGRGFLAGATALGLERARVSAAAGAQERDFEQDLATQELGLRGREVAAKETTAQAATVTAAAKATAGAKLTDRLKALGDVTRRTNPVSGTTELIVGTTSIPQSRIPVFENFASSFQSDPDFQAEHGNKTPAEQDRIAARMSVELMTAQGLVASGRAASGIEEIEKAFGG